MDVPQIMYADPALIDTIVGELKSQGTFDQFRKECIADVDTKPAYQNLHQRVETTVANFLEGKTWRPDMNKNQLRDSLRKHIHEMGFLETGVERIVDQVVNPKVHAVFMPQVEDVVYRVQGIPKPNKKSTAATPSVVSTSKNGGVFNSSLFSQPPPFLPGLSFLPAALQNHMQKAPTLADLLPTDLDPVSPESSKDSDDDTEVKEKGESSTVAEESHVNEHNDDSQESQLSGISDLTSHGSDHAPSVKSGRRNSNSCDGEDNEDSQASISKLSDSSIETESKKEEPNKNVQTEDADYQEISEAKKTNFEEINSKSLYPGGSEIEYEDQFSIEEEVATTVHNEASCENLVKDEPVSPEIKRTSEAINHVDFNLPKDAKNASKQNFAAVHQKYRQVDELNTNVLDENSIPESEESQFSGSSDNKLQIDEMKDFNSQSETSRQHEDEQSCMKTSSEGFLSEESNKGKAMVENIVEASEEARHGFDDSQDALERPPLPQAQSPLKENFVGQPPLPPMPPIDSNSDEKPPPPPSPLVERHEGLPTSPSEASDDVTTPSPTMTGNLLRAPLPQTPPAEKEIDAELPPLPATSPLAERFDTLEGPPLPTTPPIAEKSAGIEQPPLPQTPPLPQMPPLPQTPPLPENLKGTEQPPLPPSPPSGNLFGVLERPPLPPTPPSTERMERPPLPPTPPCPPSKDESSHNSNASPLYDEGSVPKTPRWEPRSPRDNEKHIFSSFKFIGNSNKIPSTFIPSLKKSEHDEESQSGSEEMQLAWSPLSTHGDEDSRERHVSGLPQQFEKSSQKMSPEVLASNDSLERSNEVRHSAEQHRESKRDAKNVVDDSNKQREKDRSNESKSKDRRKEDERSYKDSSGSSKKHEDRSSKHRDSRDRKDSSSRSRHDKERERHSSSSHHRSDDKRRDEKREDKERSSSSKHKSSRSDDRHRHRDREHRNSNSTSSSIRHEDKSHDRSSKSDDKKSSSKSHSGDRVRRDSERKERDSRDKDRKSERDRDRSRKESSRHDEKKRDKEKEKVKNEKSSNICRPNNERRSPDPDSKNGSMFGGHNRTSSSFEAKDNQQDSSHHDSGKASGSSDSNSKSSESSQQNTACADTPLLLSPTSNQLCPSSSLPFKKRPLLPESELRDEHLSGQLILRIKKLKRSTTDVIENTKSKKIKAIRRLENQSIRNLDDCSRFSLKVHPDAECPPPIVESPIKYFENNWPTQSDDKAFLSFVQDLEQSKTLSELSDFSGSDSEEEEVLNIDDSINSIEHRKIVLSLCVLADDQALKLQESSLVSHGKHDKGMIQKSSNLNAKARNQSRQRKLSTEHSSGKRRKINPKETLDCAPLEQKSRRARKPNKRYSNDEFTSHFDCEEDVEPEEEKDLLVGNSTETEDNVPHTFENQEPITSRPEEHSSSHKTSSYNVDQQEKENNFGVGTENMSLTDNQPPKPAVSQSRQQPSYTWNRDSYNSNSEDEMENTNNESDLIGTALKNLMMESGLGKPNEESGTKMVTSTRHPNLKNSSPGIIQKSIPLSGVKRVGLSRNYKGSKKFSVRQAAASVSCDFSLPSSLETDVLAHTQNEDSVTLNEVGSRLEATDLEINSETSPSKLCLSRVKQHYSSDDLYKPRPPLRLTSKRRQIVPEQDGVF